MNFEDFISSTDSPRPRKVVIYGSKGIGKTTLAAACPFGPVVFLPTELSELFDPYDVPF